MSKARILRKKSFKKTVSKFSDVNKLISLATSKGMFNVSFSTKGRFAKKYYESLSEKGFLVRVYSVSERGTVEFPLWLISKDDLCIVEINWINL